MREQPSIVKAAVPGGIDLDLVESHRFVDGSELLAQLLNSRRQPFEHRRQLPKRSFDPKDLPDDALALPDSPGRLGWGEGYARRMAACRIIVCPRGWGEQSLRHWDTWLSGKPMLTDRHGDSIELIPGMRLRDGVHYLVFDEPEQIPGLVEHWTHPSRRDQLDLIARNGRDAAQSYDSLENIVRFFHRAVPRRTAA